MEYCSRGNLYDYIHKSDVEILPHTVVAWSRQITGGMQYLHSKKIIHRDLKSMKWVGVCVGVCVDEFLLAVHN